MRTFDMDEILNALTIQEKKVLTLVIEGLTSKQIAEALFSSESTIKKHREHILRKADVKGVCEIWQFLTAVKLHLS